MTTEEEFEDDNESVQVGWRWVHKSCAESLRRWLETHPDKVYYNDDDD